MGDQIDKNLATNSNSPVCQIRKIQTNFKT